MRKTLLTILSMLACLMAWSQVEDPLSDDAEAYAILSSDGQTLTFAFDNERANQEGTTFPLDDTGTSPGWKADKAGITKVVFLPSFADARPTTTRCWFEGMTLLTDIEGLENLNTSEVTVMSYMFYNCQKLKHLDLHTFDTHNVTLMDHMFQYCLALEDMDLSSFDTTKSTSFQRMFQGCSRLHALDLSSFTFNSEVDSRYLLYNSTGLESLTLSQSMETMNATACTGVGTREKPCVLVVPPGFDTGTDTSGDYFRWKAGYFRFSCTEAVIHAAPLLMEAGSTSLLTIQLDNDTTKTYNGYQMDIHLPEGLSFVENDEQQYAIQPSDRYSHDDMMVTVMNQGDGNYRLIAFSLSNAIITGTEGPLFTIEIEADSLLATGEYVGRISNITLSSVEAVSTRPEDTDFTITIMDAYPMGDVNHDREVDVRDVMLVVGYVLGFPDEVFYIENADMDADGLIDISDIMGIVGIILNG